MQFPAWSDYAGSADNPIFYIDVNGEEAKPHPAKFSGEIQNIYSKMNAIPSIKSTLDGLSQYFAGGTYASSMTSSPKPLLIMYAKPHPSSNQTAYGLTYEYVTGENASYYGVVDNTGIIVINANAYNNKPLGKNEVLLVGTIVHEHIHAYLHSEIREILSKPSDALSERDKIKLDWYNKAKTDKSLDWSHEYMAEYGRDLIAKAMKEYDQSKYTAEELKKMGRNDQYYDDMAWSGLYDTAAYKNLPKRDRVRIMRRLQYKSKAIN